MRFDAVQIIDDLTDHPDCTSTVGADIDASRPQAYVSIKPVTWGSIKGLYRD